MKCQECQEQISQLLDNELTKDALPSVFQHLAECDECRNFFLQTNRIHDNVKGLEYSAVPEEIDQKFELLGLKGTVQLPMTRQRTVSITTAVLSGIMAIMIGILSLILFNKSVHDERLSIHHRQFESIYQQNAFNHQTFRPN